MSRPPKPTVIHEATGAYKKNPNRQRKNEAKPRLGIGSAPKAPALDFAGIWDEIVSASVPGVMGNCDRTHLELLCNMLVEYRANPIDMPAARITLIEKMLGKLGMNPIDRIRISVPEQEQKSKQDEYF